MSSEFAIEARKINKELLSQNAQYRFIYEHKHFDFESFMRSFAIYTNDSLFDDLDIIIEYIKYHWSRIAIVQYVYKFVADFCVYRSVELQGQTGSLIGYWETHPVPMYKVMGALANHLMITPAAKRSDYEDEVNIIRKYFPLFKVNILPDIHAEFWKILGMNDIYKLMCKETAKEYMNKYTIKM